MKAVVKNGRLVMSEPTLLPEGTELELVVDDGGDDLDDEERARLEASLRRGVAQMRAGRGIPAEKVLRDSAAALPGRVRAEAQEQVEACAA